VAFDFSAPVVLIVEDEWVIREEIAQELKRADLVVLEASSGEGAAGFLRNGQPIDVLITDIQLAGYVSGWEVGEAFRAVYPNISVIYTSGNSIDKSRSVPGSMFFTKPCRAKELCEACRGLLRRAGRDLL
jgi:DNA-binding response OmpR family regulator